MKRLTLLSMVLLLAGWTVVSGNARVDGMQALQRGGTIVVTWRSITEVDLDLYELRRRTPFDAGYQVIGKIPARGSGRTYEFEDRDVYKSAADDVEYVLYAVFTSADPVELTRVSTRYTSTSVRRTWGSIKAMFQ